MDKDDFMKCICDQIAKEGCNQATPVVSQQMDHTMGRFNETSAQTTASMQQAHAMQMATWGAHLLKLQHDICHVGQPTQPASQ